MGVESRVYGRIHWDKALNDASIDLTVTADGVITLTGTVADAKAKARAVDLTKETVGVTKVVDTLAIRPDGDHADQPLMTRRFDRGESKPGRRRPEGAASARDCSICPIARRIRDRPGSADDRVDDPGQLATGLGEAVEIVLAGAAGLDEPAVAEQGQVVADRRLALRARGRRRLGDVPLLLVEQHQDLEPGRVGHLLEQVGHATDLG